MLGDPELKNCKEGDIIQLQRRGFFRVDRAYAPPSPHTGKASPVILFEIPDGHQAKEKTAATIPANKKSTISNSVAPINTITSTNNNLGDRIAAQGNLVRDLKTQKAEKSKIDIEVKSLLALKAEYKSEHGTDWTPGSSAPASASVKASASSTGDLNARITNQGLVVRDLKAKKAEKAKIDAEVKTLLALKAEFKVQTGKDWTQSTPATSAVPKTTVISSDDINERITKQGNLIRDLKTQKAEKSKIDAEVKTLLALKAEFKSQTGTDWSPNATQLNASVAVPVTSTDDLSDRITKQGALVRDLKAQKVDKSKIDAEVKTLLSLKAEFKVQNGKDWTPNAVTTTNNSASAANNTVS